MKLKSSKNPILVKNPETGNEEDAEEDSKHGNINRPMQLLMREIRNEEQSMEKNHTFDD